MSAPEEPQCLPVLTWLSQRDLECDSCSPICTLAVDRLAASEKAVDLRIVVGVRHEEGPLGVASLGGVSCCTRANVVSNALHYTLFTSFSLSDPHAAYRGRVDPHTHQTHKQLHAPSPPFANVQSRSTSTSKHPRSPNRRIASSTNFSAKKPRSGDPADASWAASSHSLRLNCMARPLVRACSTRTALSRATPHRHWPRPRSKWKNRVSYSLAVGLCSWTGRWRMHACRVPTMRVCDSKSYWTKHDRRPLGSHVG